MKRVQNWSIVLQRHHSMAEKGVVLTRTYDGFQLNDGMSFQPRGPSNMILHCVASCGTMSGGGVVFPYTLISIDSSKQDKQNATWDDFLL